MPRLPPVTNARLCFSESAMSALRKGRSLTRGCRVLGRTSLRLCGGRGRSQQTFATPSAKSQGRAPQGRTLSHLPPGARLEERAERNVVRFVGHELVIVDAHAAQSPGQLRAEFAVL